jgi:3'-phosphoadenosine 5'-phosphosulfate sulfotransferase (PAPS reductase)/FAD synthetase
MDLWTLRERQKLPLEIKERMTFERIREWYEYYNGQVYISFSGGKDSTVLLHCEHSSYSGNIKKSGKQ